MGFLNGSSKEKPGSDSPPPFSGSETDFAEGLSADNADQLQRHLRNRQIQLIAIGGSIGTALFVSIGNGLYHAGAAGLLLAFVIQSCVLAMVNNCVAEMSTAYPVSGGFIRHAGKWVDDALGFMGEYIFVAVSSKKAGPRALDLLLPKTSCSKAMNMCVGIRSTIKPLTSTSAATTSEITITDTVSSGYTLSWCACADVFATL